MLLSLLTPLKSPRELAVAALLAVSAALFAFGVGIPGVDDPPRLGDLIQRVGDVWWLLAAPLGALVWVAIYHLLAHRLRRWSLAATFLLVPVLFLGLQLAILDGRFGIVCALAAIATLPIAAIQIWLIATDLFTVEDGERVLAVALALTSVLTLLMLLGAQKIGYPSVQWRGVITIVSVAASAVPLLILARMFPDPTPPPATEKNTVGPRAFPFVALLFAIITLIELAKDFAKSGLNAEIAQVGPERAASVVGDAFMAANVVLLAFAILVFPRLVARFGAPRVAIAGAAVGITGLGLQFVGGDVGLKAGHVVATLGIVTSAWCVALFWLRVSRPIKFSGRVAVSTVALLVGAVGFSLATTLGNDEWLLPSAMIALALALTVIVASRRILTD